MLNFFTEYFLPKKFSNENFLPIFFKKNSFNFFQENKISRSAFLNCLHVLILSHLTYKNSNNKVLTYKAQNTIINQHCHIDNEFSDSLAQCAEFAFLRRSQNDAVNPIKIKIPLRIVKSFHLRLFLLDKIKNGKVNK